MIAVFITLSVLGLAAVAGTLIIKKLIQICQPNEVLVFSGGARRQGNRTVGYRIVQGGRALRVPLLETVSRMDLTNMVIDIRVEGAYSRGGIPLNVEGVANVKVASDALTLHNAIVRFLGKPRGEIVRVAKETLEGNLRGVLATLTPEEVNQDRVKFATSLLHEADGDLRKLGLVLDTLKVQSVWDDVGYLDSLGRKQSADLVMRSRIAEAENQATSVEKSASNHEEKERARIDAELEVLKAENERRVVDARTKMEARVAEERSEVTAQVARARADLEVQKARVEQVRRKLTADKLRRAQAEKAKLIEVARAQAAPILEDGRATAQAMRLMGRAWVTAGDDAKRVFLAQNLGKLSTRVLDSVKAIDVDRVTVIDASLSGGDDLAVRARVASDKLKETLGVDVPKLLGGMTPSAS
jgi:flotillin